MIDENEGRASKPLKPLPDRPGILSSNQLADGYWAKMAQGKFYCIVSGPNFDPESEYKAQVLLRMEDIVYDKPPLTMMESEGRAKVKELASKL